MRVDEIIRALPDVGLRLTNLFEMEGGVWRANMRDRDTMTGLEFGDGATPVEALCSCLLKAGVDVRDE